MSALRDKVIAEARSWIDTPFRHQARVKGMDGGVDCSNLIIGVGENAGVWQVNLKRLEKVWMPFYGRRPNSQKMRKALVDLGLVPIVPAEAGVADIAWMHWGNDMPIHMAILGELAGRQTLVHAIWPHWVVEQTLDEHSRMLVTEYFRFPGIAADEEQGA